LTENQTISFIGAGNMAGAIIGGMLERGYAPSQIWASSPDDVHLQKLRERYGISITTDNRYCVEQGSLVVLAVKPQIMKSVCEQIAPTVQNTRPVLISIAAGLTADTLDGWLGGHVPLVRVMPNTPSLVGKGASGLFANAEVTDEQKQRVEKIFASVGIVQWVDDESLLHAVTALSGSGPAYFFLMLEALEEAATNNGLDPQTARQLAIQTMAGAAEMAARSGEEPGQLKRNVMSPNGVTERAIEAFEEGGLRALVSNASKAAYSRSEEMARELSASDSGETR